MRTAVALVAVLVPVLVACEQVDCTPTTTVAADARKVDLVAPGSSAVLRATLTTQGRPLAGRSMTFDVQVDGDTVYDAPATTGDGGTASLDLKRADPQAIAGIARGNGFRASFAGDATYCASSDDAPLRVVRAPAGIEIG